MKEMIHKILFIVMVMAILPISFTACTKDQSKDSAASSKNNSNTEYVYKGTSSEISKEIRGSFEHFAYYNGKVYFISEYDVDGKGERFEYSLNIANLDGSGYQHISLADDKSILFICQPMFDQDGTGYYIECRQKKKKRRYLLKMIDSNGKETKSVDITKTVSKKASDLYPSHLCISKEHIYIADYDQILVIDKKGKSAGYITGMEDVESLAADRNGDVYAYLYKGPGFELCKVDLAKEKLEDSLEFPFEAYGTTIMNGNQDTDFFVNDGTALYSFNTDGKKSEILNWIASGISMIEVADIFYKENEVICIGKSYPYEEPKITVLTKQKGKTEKKKELVLAGSEYAITSLLEHSIVKFNSANDDYRITVKKYYGEDTEQLTLDMMSGHVPDILISDSYTSIENLIARGIFADLYEFMDSDKELNRDDFLSNLLEACETDGKLYRFTDCFQIYTLIGKTSVFGDTMGITVDKLNQIAKKFPKGTEILPGSTKEDMLRFTMELSGSSFIDYKNGSCSFDSNDFIQMLEYANTYLDSMDYDAYFDESFWKKFDTMFRDESSLLMLTQLEDYADIYRFEHTNFGEEVTAVGFPCEGRIGTSFVIETAFSICEKSKYKEGAWEFIRTVLLPEYQDCCNCFPVRKDSLEKRAKAAMKYEKDRMNSALVIIGQMALTSSVGDIGQPKKKDIEHMNEIIDSANGLMTYDEKVMDIIMEEAAAYFKGDKPAKETAQLIQTRVQLYLNEKA